MSEPKLPNMIVIGAPASGTSDLLLHLSSHPEIFISEDHEIEFFASEKNLSRGLDWYKAHFKAKTKIRGERASYARFPWVRDVPERIHEHIPNAKLIYMLRDPIERVVEEYMINRRVGREDRNIRAALAMLKDNPYIDHSKYHLQLEQYWKCFRKGQIHLLSAEELRRDPRSTLERLYAFLKVDRSHFSPEIHQRICAPRKSEPATSAATETSFWERLRHAWLGRPDARVEDRPRLDVDLRARLEIAFADDVAQLRETTGLKFELWSL